MLGGEKGGCRESWLEPLYQPSAKVMTWTAILNVKTLQGVLTAVLSAPFWTLSIGSSH